MQTTGFRTETGSVYTVIERDDGRYFLHADNVATGHSVPVVGEHEIAQPSPWPIVVGEGVTMFSIHYDDHAHPERMPGGGKFTSRVVEIF